MAKAFIINKKTNNTKMAPAVFSAKARSGLSDHKKICTGRVVAASVIPPGTSTIKATMPINSNGAVSPKMCAMDKMDPVIIPGME